MGNKKTVFIFIFSLFLFNTFANDIKEPDFYPETQAGEVAAGTTEEAEVAKENANLKKKLDLMMEFTPIIHLSPESRKNNSNSVNIFYSLTFGCTFPADFIVSFQPSLSMFVMNHSWFNNMPVPIEIENRTTTTLSLMLNLPAAFNLDFSTSRLQFTLGAGVFIRFSYLANGVDRSAAGTSGSAADDVKLINKWFWDNGRWLYITAGINWLYNITDKIKIGPTANIHIPIAEIIDTKSVHDLMFVFGIKLCI